MKHPVRKLITSACATFLLGTIQLAYADTAQDSERLFNWAESTYPDFSQVTRLHKTSNLGYSGIILTPVFMPT